MFRVCFTYNGRRQRKAINGATEQEVRSNIEKKWPGAVITSIKAWK